MKLKIAIVLEATLGGTRKHIIDILNLLPKEQFDITFIYSTHRADPAFFECIEELQQQKIKMVKIPMTNSILSLSNIYLLFKLHFFFKKEKFDIIHLHAAIAGFIGRVACLGNAHVKTIFYSPHGGSFHLMSGIRGTIIRNIERLLAFKKVRIIAVSECEKKKILDELKIPESKVTVIHNGIHIKTHRSCINRSNFLKENGLNLPENALIILYPAVFLPAKGHMNFFSKLINAEVKLNNIFILLAGDGPQQSLIKTIVDQSPINNNVIFLGFKTDIDAWMELSDLVILPSKSEAFGYVVLEAFLAKKPVFASRVGGILDIIEDGKDGLMFNYDSIESMFESIVYYSSRRSQLESMGLNGYNKVVDKFSVNKMLEKLNSEYSS